uniref:Uncharacterized protein n=1 Tax=Schistocephalus solidus TaxID=70667 RepID=A0A0X3NGT0_SCHSO
MTELNYQMICTANKAREADKFRSDSRKKNLLLLVMHYLKSEGFLQAAEALRNETNLDFTSYEICDNIDLDTILMDFESFYFVKFNKYPKISKKIATPCEKLKNSAVSVGSTRKKRFVFLILFANFSKYSTFLPKISSSSANSMNSSTAIVNSQPNAKVVSVNSSECMANSLDLVAEGISASSPSPVIQNRIASSDCRMSQKCGPVIDFRAIVNQENRMSQSEEILSEERLLRPLGLYAGYSAEWKDLAATISRDIYLHNPNVHWDDIIGLESAKRLVKEAVVYPISYPQLFTGILSPWRGLLLYGPPGKWIPYFQCNDIPFNKKERVKRYLQRLLQRNAKLPFSTYLPQLSLVNGGVIRKNWSGFSLNWLGFMHRQLFSLMNLTASCPNVVPLALVILQEGYRAAAVP